jgi:hypothetical protein
MNKKKLITMVQFSLTRLKKTNRIKQRIISIKVNPKADFYFTDFK